MHTRTEQVAIPDLPSGLAGRLITPWDADCDVARR